MKKAHKGRLLSFRSGDRSEYLALYFISRFAYISPVPRQEDFGLADFMCFLGQESPPYLYGENAFFIQVKSKENLKPFNEDSTNYLKKHSDLPFLLCIVDKSGQRFKLYSFWRLWYALIFHNLQEIKKISYVPDIYALRINNKVFNLSESGILEIALWKPILQIKYSEIESQFPKNTYQILKFWLDLERLNLVALRTHKAFFSGVKNWEPNLLPHNSDFETYYHAGMNIEYLEKVTAGCLTALSFNYEHQKKNKELRAISEVLKVLPENYLDNLGKCYRSKKIS